MTKSIRCRCGASVPVPADASAVVACPSCQTPLPVGASDVPGDSAAAAAPRPGGDLVIHRCLKCGKPSRVKATFVGKKVRCPHCKEPGTVVAADSAAPRPSSDTSISKRMEDVLEFAQEKEVDLKAQVCEDSNSAPRSASGRSHRPASTTLGPAPAGTKTGTSGSYRRSSTTRRNRSLARGSGGSGAHRAVSASGIREPAAGGASEKIWLYIAGGLVVVIGVLVFALLKLVR